MQPTISIIVPIFRVENYLERCINSILNQSFKNFELILVDDGSPDRCGEICDEYGKKDNRIKVIHKKNGGLSDARNAGLEIASGVYVGFIDSDDFIHKDMYKILYEGLIKTNSDIAQCKFKYFSNIDEIKENNNIIEKIETYNNIEAINGIMDNKELNTNVWNKLYKRDLFKEIVFPKGKIHEDEFVTYKLFYKSKRICSVNKELYYYFNNSNGIMQNLNIDSKFHWVEAIEERNKFLLDNKEVQLFNKSNNILFFNLLNLRYSIKKSNNLSGKSEKYKIVNNKIKNALKDIEDKSNLSLMNKVFISLMKLNFSFVVFYDLNNYLISKK